MLIYNIKSCMQVNIVFLKILQYPPTRLKEKAIPKIATCTVIAEVDSCPLCDLQCSTRAYT